jgi:hydroxypyruvate isomerase
VPRFSANLTLLFTDRPFLDRFAAAAAAGFRAVEFMFPYEFEVGQLREVLQRNEIELDLFNLPAGDFGGGERGIAVAPGRRVEFRRGVEAALSYAPALGTRKLNCLVGLRDPSLTWDAQYSCAVENLTWAAGLVGESDITLHVEQLNPIETPGFFLDNLAVAEQLLADVASPHLRIQFDVYHVQRTQGNVVATLRRLIDRVGHVQIADSPGRGEPGTGELAYRYILGELDSLGYPGRVGLEYRPTLPIEESFRWVSEYGWRIDL